MCSNTRVYESLLLCASFFAFFFCFVFVLPYTMAYNVFYFVLFHIIAIISLFIFCDERVRERGFGWVEKKRKSTSMWSTWRKGNCDKNILYEKKIHFKLKNVKM